MVNNRNRKRGILPRLAVMGIRKNASTYLPFVTACVFATFTFFTFDSILHNKIMDTLPKAAYVKILILTGLVLLGLILIPFLFYTNSFLIKRRIKELGLYSILGMEKKHTAVLMMLESLILYLIVVTMGIGLGVVFSKLMFLLLLNLIDVSPDTAFTFSQNAFFQTVLFMGGVFLLNLLSNLIQVGKSNPVELLQSGRRGEKNPRHLWIFAVLGAVILAGGYWIAATAVIDSMIFTNFFLAIFLVVAGTYLLFTSGSIAFLRVLKMKKSYYYKASNFITVSGMLYRMKKNAVSLVNICIFATMTMVTLLCTVSLFAGTNGILKFMYPFDYEIEFQNAAVTDKEAIQEDIQTAAEAGGVTLTDYIAFSYMKMTLIQEGNQFLPSPEVFLDNNYQVHLLTAEEYNRIEGEKESLAPDEILIYSTGSSFMQDTAQLGGKEYRVKKELQELVLEEKAEENSFQKHFYIIVRDEEVLKECCAAYGGMDGVNARLYKILLNFEGSEENWSQFMQTVYTEQLAEKPGFLSVINHLGSRERAVSMNGGLLFLGLFFGSIFIMCLLLIMYYKQITEGFEDKESFEIMQKVGMSDKEVRATIRKQIILVFLLPLAGALLHMAAGLNMVIQLMATINLFHTRLILLSMLFVVIIFVLFYFASYLFTAKTYYKIVKEMA